MKEYDGYSAKYDAFFYTDTMKWGQAACGDPLCEYCKDRPETPEGLSNDIDQLKIQDFDKLDKAIVEGFANEDPIGLQHLMEK